MSGTYRALGMMSGTSMDGIDLAVMETDGEGLVTAGKTAFRPYREEERALIRKSLEEARVVGHRAERTPAMAAAEAAITRAHEDLVRTFLDESGLAPQEIDVIGFHGQTLFHAPERRLTVQIGDARALARALGIDVVTDMRVADVEAGGEGAPLVPVYHRALVASAELSRPVAIVNIGGVANATWIGAGENDLIAFDTGPGNALMDDFIARRTGAAMDSGGALAAKGRVDEALLSRWLDNPYFSRRPPKSLDRDAFACEGLDLLSTEDGLATLAAFTAETIARGLALLPRSPELIVVVGGGARNPTLLDHLSRRSGIDVRTADAVGWAADFVEAQAFAYLAVRSLKGLPLTFPGTTGAPSPMTGGVLMEA
ncbi:anhydro-N-acetylmuramic acid kinase [Breoghania corrubedonensis]|uniref:Anhydro-N-acetylmuramic acid kinase n=1 Tax=Breoghania corrubedonensis TaxID=665038 RepID=A0A2T5V8L9_9HYPH|nr:anhydro-N-acetylmuramic acid kinase [Breoghania corrubedonensis]PTW60092.1 anhydro-N-acetylmuramic acid kinase [Breoghania corrubedonensis]